MLIETKAFCPDGAKNCHDDTTVKHRAKTPTNMGKTSSFESITVQ